MNLVTNVGTCRLNLIFIIPSLLYIQIKLTDIYNNNEMANVLQCFKTYDQIYAKI